MGSMGQVSALRLISTRPVKMEIDPFDVVKRLIRESPMSHRAIAIKSGVSKETLKRWMDGVTQRPQVPTVSIVLRTLGYRLEVVRI